MAQAHCVYCGSSKKGPEALELLTPCAICMGRINEVEEIFDPPPQNNIVLVTRWFAYRDYRFFVILGNDGRFSICKGQCEIGIGNRELDPEITMLKDLWKNTTPVGTDPRHGHKRDGMGWGWMNCVWSQDYWPTTQDILLAINAHLIFCEWNLPVWPP